MAYTNIDNPELYFQAKLYSGNASTNAITLDGSENMRPDWLWIKCRSHADSSQLFDVLRGTNALRSDDTHADADASSNGFTSFDSNGFTLNGSNGGGNVNNSGRTYAAWNWNANGSGSSNSDGSITSSVSANTTAGFSIVSWTGTAANATVGHGLGVAPKVIIVKNRIDTTNWNVFHESVGNTGSLYLNSNQTTETYQPFWNNTSPTSSVFTVGSDGATNGSSDAMIAYCFADVQGYSKFGSYTGNGNADGAFVYCGFEPAFVIIKGAASGDGTAAQHWEMYDNKRNVFNPQNKALFPSLNSAESTESRINFLSNGFKAIINSDGVNDNNSTYIFMAFAESPFVNSSGIPNNAR